QGAYLNQMVLLETALEPAELLVQLHAIESERGRERRAGVRWGPRTLDLDVVRFGDRVLREPHLVIPHPELPNRPFWLRELAELEGGAPMAQTVRALVDVGIPVMGHLGLTPQSVHALGGYRVQGRDEPTAERLKLDAKALQDAGAFSIVLELVPAPLASQITKSLTIPTIGIGAGPACD